MKKKITFKEKVKMKNGFDGQLLYGYKNFNRDSGRTKHNDQRKISDNQWLDVKTNIIHEKYALHRNCPICNSNNKSILFIKSGFPHYVCNNCTLIYVSPCLLPEVYSDYSRTANSYANVLSHPTSIKLDKLKFKYGLDNLRQYLKPNDKICDIGSGPGTFSILAKKNGYKVYAIEPNEKCQINLIDNNIDFGKEFYPHHSYQSMKWDAIAIWAILEHVHEPTKFVESLRNNLNPGGYLFVNVPNADALVTRIHGSNSNVFGGHEHIQFFNKKTLGMLLEKYHFEVLEFDTMISEIGTIKHHLNFSGGQLLEEADPFNFLSPDFIYKNDFGSALTAIAKAV